ncbi:MAG: response regulator [Deltaproteobacteria bacterium]|nr:response regulator [Deltaproteobacteria bacterium]
MKSGKIIQKEVVQLSPDYSCTFISYTNGILETIPEGVPDREAFLHFIEKRKHFLLISGMAEKPIIEIKCYGKTISSINRELRTIFSDHLKTETESGNLKGFFAYDTPFYVGFLFKAGVLLMNPVVPIQCVSTRDKAWNMAVSLSKNKRMTLPHKIKAMIPEIVNTAVNLFQNKQIGADTISEQDISELFSFITSISWKAISSKNKKVDFPENHPFFPVYMSLYLLMQDFESILKSKIEVENKLKIRSEIANLRANIWRTGQLSDLKESELINSIIMKAGSSFKTGRIIYSLINSDLSSECVSEWCDSTRSSVLGRYFPPNIAIYLKENNHSINHPELILNDSASNTVLGEFQNTEKLESAVIIPLIIDGKMKGWFSFEDCHKLFGEIFFQEVTVIATEIVMIITTYLEQRNSRKALENIKSELELRVIERTSELRGINSQLMEAMEKLRSVSEIKSRFLANMSHEMRTPLNGIIGFAEIIENSSNAIQSGDYAHTIKKESNRLLKLINQLLDLSKIEAGKMEIDLSDFSLKELLDNTVKTFRVLCDKKHLDFKFNYSENMPVFLSGDSMKLHQVLVNLLGNAVKFTETGHISLEVKPVEIHEDILTISFIVEDTGIGIPTDGIDRIFEDFVQLDSSITRKFGGTGLGISLSRKFVNLMGGELEFSSEEGKGSKFWFLLPFKTVEKSAMETSRLRSMKTEFTDLSDVNILYAEDYITNQEIVRHFIHQHNGNLTIVDTGIKALEAIENIKNFDIVLMDIQMPELDGFGTTIKLREKYRIDELPIIGLTANAFQKDIDDCLKCGMNDVLTKPFSSIQLINIISRYLPKIRINQNKPVTLPTDPESQGSDLPLNFMAFLDKVGGNKAAASKIINGFTEKLESQFDELAISLNEKNSSQVSLIAHSIKGGALTVCALPLSNSAREIEILSKQKIPVKSELIKSLHREIQILREYVLISSNEWE